MRIAVCALSAILLSGCSWFGDYGQSTGTYHYGQSGGTYQAHQGQQPQGTYQQSSSHAGGFPQQPNFNRGNYTTGGYGSHASSAGQQGANHSVKPRLKKPKLRGSLSMGFEKSISGSYLDYSKVPTLNPELGYDPTDYNEVFNAPPPATDGVATSETYSAVIEDVQKPNVAFDDAHSTPFHLQAGLEYITSPHFTVFANAGYAYSEGEEGEAVRINGALTRTTSDQAYVMGAPVGMPVVNTSAIPNAGRIASFTYNFSDMRRMDAEVGGRYYFDPLVKDQQHRTVTPFVSASAGVAHYNSQSLTVGQQQAFYQRNYNELTGTPPENFELSTFTVPTPTTPVPVYDSGIVPKGTFKAGMEWQVTKGAALALETGITYEGGREYSNGEKGDANISVPLTLRGSFNF